MLQPAHRACLLLPAACVLAATLCGCARKEDAPVEATPAVTAPAAPEISYLPLEAARPGKETAGALMRALFPDAVAPDESDPAALLRPAREDGYELMTLVAAKELADGRSAVVVNGAPTDAKGVEPPAHGESGTLHVYLMHKQGEEWIVDSRHEGLAELGSHGSIGQVSWAHVGPDKEGFVVSSGYTGQGHTIGQADIVALSGGVRHLGSIPTVSDDSGGCGEQQETCMDAEGALRFIDGSGFKGYREVRVDFTGRHYTVSVNDAGEQVERVREQIKQTARYRFDGERYVLASGASPLDTRQ